jgi:hypothetical protein
MLLIAVRLLMSTTLPTTLPISCVKLPTSLARTEPTEGAEPTHPTSFHDHGRGISYR